MPIINQVVAGSGGGSSVAEPYLTYGKPSGFLSADLTTNHIVDLTGVTSTRIYALYRAYSNLSEDSSLLPVASRIGNSLISGVVNFSDVVYPGEYAFYETFYGCPNITGANLHNMLQTPIRACYRTFSKTGVTSCDLSSLRLVYGEESCYQTFSYCSGLITVSLPALKSVTGKNGMQGCFLQCINLETASIPLLESVTGEAGIGTMFSGTKLITFNFESLITITAQYALRYTFNACSSLQSVWFYALNTGSFGSRTNQFNNMLSGVTGCTVHFPMAIQSTIGSWSDVTAGFGGTNTTVLFDIVTTLTGADGNTYTRQEKDSTTTATAWVYNDTLYYTSGVSDNTNGVNEPTVSDAIYSDAACTTAVTTISAIA